jgi:hypothetical protein
MSAPTTPPSREEIGRLGRDVFDRQVRPRLRPEDDGKYVAVDVDTGDYETDADDYTANMRLLARRPGARIWLTRAGHAAAYRMANLAECRR